MTPAETGAARIRRLRAEIDADRAILQERHEDIETYVRGVEDAPPERAAALALALDRAYTTLEAILTRVARTLEGGSPTGDDSRRTLLHNARLEIPDVRVAVLSPETVEGLDELRRFRHFLRHAYGARLDATRVCAVAEIWLGASDDVFAALGAFGRFLAQLAAELEAPAE